MTLTYKKDQPSWVYVNFYWAKDGTVNLWLWRWHWKWERD